MIGIYKITNPKNKVYIGQSTNIEERLYRYKILHCKNQTLIYRSLIKYGVDKHKFEILHECEPEQLNELEIYYIELFQCFNNKYGLNLRSGGGSGGYMSDETKNKLSKINIGKTIPIDIRNKISNLLKGKNNPNYGKRMSSEQKNKISKSLMGRKQPEDIKIKISEANKGRIISESTKNKISESQKGDKGYWYGKRMSDETKLKISISHKGKICSDETKLKISNKNKGHRVSDETKQKLREKSKLQIRQPFSEETKQKMRESRIKVINRKNFITTP